MSSLFLVPENFSRLAAALDAGQWVVACLCAGWCDVCKQYRAGFEALAADFPDAQFVWIDIEDQADLVGDLDVENFPTILMQREDIVAFYGTMLPEPRQVPLARPSASSGSVSAICAPSYEEVGS